MPTAVSIVQRLHQHRAWANGKLLESVAKLAPEQLHQPFEIGQGSVWKSLVHMYAAEYVWIDVLRGNPNACCPGDLPGQLPGNQLGQGGVQSFDDLRQRWGDNEIRWKQYLATLDPATLDEKVERRSSAASGGKTYFIRRSDGLLHAALHAHYTLTQVVNMLRRLGVEKLPDRMLIQLVFQEGV